MSEINTNPARPLLKKIISIYGGKGGAGKTTITAELAVALVSRGYRVAVVDGDGGQASLSAKVGVDPTTLEYGLYEAIKDAQAAAKLTSKTEKQEMTTRTFQAMKSLAIQGVTTVQEGRFVVFANNMRLLALEYEWVIADGKETLLKNFLKRFVPYFDFILIDCPANRGILTFNALTASDYLVMPVETTSIGYHGATSMLGQPEDLFLSRVTGKSWATEMKGLGINPNVWNSLTRFPVTINEPDDEVDEDEVTGGFNPNLKLVAVVPSKYDKTLADNRLVLENLSRIFGVNTPDSYTQPGLLMPAIPYSGIYQSSFRLNKTGQELRGQHRQVWDFIAAHVGKVAGGEK